MNSQVRRSYGTSQAGFTGLEIVILIILIVIIIAAISNLGNGVKKLVLDDNASETVSYEERVFDNRASTDVANWNLSIKRETRTEYTFEDRDLTAVTARLNIPVEPLKAEINARLEKEQKTLIQRTEITGENETLQIPVSPRTTRTICIRWRDVWRTGHLEVLVRSEHIAVPFRLFEARRFSGYSATPCVR